MVKTICNSACVFWYRNDWFSDSIFLNRHRVQVSSAIVQFCLYLPFFEDKPMPLFSNFFFKFHIYCTSIVKLASAFCLNPFLCLNSLPPHLYANDPTFLMSKIFFSWVETWNSKLFLKILSIVHMQCYIVSVIYHIDSTTLHILPCSPQV